MSDVRNRTAASRVEQDALASQDLLEHNGAVPLLEDRERGGDPSLAWGRVVVNGHMRPAMPIPAEAHPVPTERAGDRRRVGRGRHVGDVVGSEGHGDTVYPLVIRRIVNTAAGTGIRVELHGRRCRLVLHPGGRIGSRLIETDQGERVVTLGQYLRRAHA